MNDCEWLSNVNLCQREHEARYEVRWSFSLIQILHCLMNQGGEEMLLLNTHDSHATIAQYCKYTENSGDSNKMPPWRSFIFRAYLHLITTWNQPHSPYKIFSPCYCSAPSLHIHSLCIVSTLASVLQFCRYCSITRSLL